MESNSRQVLVSEATFNRLTAGLASFDDTLDGVVSRAMDALDRVHMLPKSPSADVQIVCLRPYGKDGQGRRVVPIDAPRSKVSFSSLRGHRIWSENRLDDPVGQDLLLSLQKGMIQSAMYKASRNWNGVALVFIRHVLLERWANATPAPDTREALFGAQIAYIRADSEIPQNWSRVESFGSDKELVAIMQGLSAHQALQTIRRIMDEIRSKYPILFRLDLEWSLSPKAAFPGDRGYILFDGNPMTSKG